MNRRTAINVSTGCILAIAGVTANKALSQEQLDEKIDTLRAVWKWCSTSNQWIRVRMECLKIGDKFAMECEKGGKYRIEGTVTSTPIYHKSEGWGCDARGCRTTDINGNDADYGEAMLEMYGVRNGVDGKLEVAMPQS